MSCDDPTELVPVVGTGTRRDRRRERDRRSSSGFPLGWLVYSVVVLVITAGAAWIAVGAGR